MSDELQVYLDHLITRESFRYVRPAEEMRNLVASHSTKLTLKDLQDKSRSKLLRKPDFQRATFAWSPDDCVSLLESIISGQVVPSIIMWSSPSSGLDYILDGAHRVSVALAWLYDQWGDEPDLDRMNANDEQVRIIRKAAVEVREKVRLKIGTVSDYIEAEKVLYKIIESGGNPKNDMDPISFKRGLFYQNLLKGNIGFDIQYVVGDYKTAEDSFLKINKSGKILSEWETILIKNRDSSFARTVMSISNIASARHYWPEQDLHSSSDWEQISQKLDIIIRNVSAIHETLFKPSYQTPIKALKQPLLVASSEQRPFYLAQLLTIVSGGKGQETETETLLKKDINSNPQDIIHNAWELTNNVIDVLSHITAPFSDFAPPNQSLALVSPVYFYTNAGRPVRGLLYGLIYWLFNGSEQEVKERKYIFSAYRGAFEHIFLESKEDIISGFSRNIGSGPEVTIPTARYYNKLFDLLIKFDGDIQSDGFLDEYTHIINDITGKRGRSASGTSAKSRIFTPKQKSISLLSSLLTSAIRCDICNGILDPSGPIQHDHIQKHADGGETTIVNQRITHPFCNNQREGIERIKERSQVPVLPLFIDPELDTGVRQLKLLSDDFFM